MVDKHLTETFVSREDILHGRFLHAFRDTVSLPNGTHATREFIQHPGAVMVIPVLDDGRLVMERQFRYPVQQIMLEFPAGKLDAGEQPLACAQRELAEETGYRAAEWARAGQLHPVISYSTEFIDIWFARGLTLGSRQLDDEEFLDVVLMTPEALFEACFSGVVTDAKTLVGAFWLQRWMQHPANWCGRVLLLGFDGPVGTRLCSRRQSSDESTGPPMSASPPV